MLRRNGCRWRPEQGLIRARHLIGCRRYDRREYTERKSGDGQANREFHNHDAPPSARLLRGFDGRSGKTGEPRSIRDLVVSAHQVTRDRRRILLMAA